MGEQGITIAIIKGNTQYDRRISVNAVAVILLLYLYAAVKNRPVICRPQHNLMAVRYVLANRRLIHMNFRTIPLCLGVDFHARILQCREDLVIHLTNTSHRKCNWNKLENLDQSSCLVLTDLTVLVWMGGKYDVLQKLFHWFLCQSFVNHLNWLEC